MEVQFKGMEHLKAKMLSVREEMRGPAMRKALRAGGNVIREAMEAAAPVLDARTPGSSALEPGALKASIRVVAPRDEVPPEVLIGPSKKTEHVARFVEYGHRMVTGGQSKLLGNGKTRGPGREIGFVPAQPFLRPAFESSVAEAHEAVAASLSESLKEITG